MMKNLSILFIMLLLLFSLESESSIKNINWEFIDDQDGFKLFRANYPNSPILGIKGETIINEPIDRVFTVFHDYTRQKEWVNRLKYVEVIKMESISKRIVYSQGELPWPAMDRDFIMENSCHYNKKLKQLNCTMVSVDENKFPQYLNKDHVRGVVIDGGFQLNDLGNNQTRVMIYLHGDPRGDIPSFIVNIIQESWPKRSIKNLKNQLAKKDLITNPEITKWFGR